ANPPPVCISGALDDLAYLAFAVGDVRCGEAERPRPTLAPGLRGRMAEVQRLLVLHHVVIGNASGHGTSSSPRKRASRRSRSPWSRPARSWSVVRLHAAAGARRQYREHEINLARPFEFERHGHLGPFLEGRGGMVEHQMQPAGLKLDACACRDLEPAGSEE